METMIVGASNEAAIRALRGPAKHFYLYGPSDTGKSWLAKMWRPKALILEQWPEAEELVRLLDERWDANKEVVMIAALPPRSVATHPRLLTRIFRGAVAALAPWDEKMRAEYFAALTPDANPEARRILLEAVAGGPRILAGMATAWRADCYASTSDALANIVASYGVAPKKFQRVRVVDALEVVSAHWGITVSELCSQCRTKMIAWPRHVAVYLAKANSNLTLTEIGHAIGGRDHSTILHAFNHVRERMMKKPEVAQEIKMLETLLLTGKA